LGVGLVMRWFLVVVAALGCVTRASAQTGDADALLRAAYCVGVLKRSIQQAQIGSVETQGVCVEGWSALRFQSAEDCDRNIPSLFGELSTMIQDGYRAKQKRYAQYLVARLMSAHPRQIEIAKTIMLKGEKDAADKRSASPTSRIRVGFWEFSPGKPLMDKGRSGRKVL